MNAVRAYFEWMPIRQVEMDDNLRIWRSFSIGTLLDLIMLDTRQYDRSITDLYWNTHYVHQISNDAGRSMMGSRQENWFFSQLKASAQRAATWRVVGSQTVFSRINESIAYGNVDPLDYDAWVGDLLSSSSFRVRCSVALSVFPHNFQPLIETLIWRIVRMGIKQIETEHSRLYTTITLETISSSLAILMRIGPATSSGSTSTRTTLRQGTAASELSSLGQQSRRRHLMARTSL